MKMLADFRSVLRQLSHGKLQVSTLSWVISSRTAWNTLLRANPMCPASSIDLVTCRRTPRAPSPESRDSARRPVPTCLPWQPALSAISPICVASSSPRSARGSFAGGVFVSDRGLSPSSLTGRRLRFFAFSSLLRSGMKTNFTCTYYGTCAHAAAELRSWLHNLNIENCLENLTSAAVSSYCLPLTL